MSKTASKTPEDMANVEFPTFDTSKTTDQFRAFAEKGVEQSKEVYSKMKSGAETTQKAIESTFETAKAAGRDLSFKTLATMRTNAEMGFSHLEALMGVKSVSEFVELQTAFLRKGIETVVAQTKDMQTAAGKAAEDVSRPMKDIFEKSVHEARVA